MAAKRKYLLMVLGPTASGKTACAAALARHYGTGVISADSRQFYREMHIGTAAPTKEERSIVPHYLCGHISIHDYYNASRFEQDALELISTLHEKSDMAVLTGGSGLYLDVMERGIDELPPVDMALRQELTRLANTDGLGALLSELQEKDPAYCTIMDKRNKQRIIRAIEVIRLSGRSFSSYHTGQKAERPFQVLKAGLEWDRDELYDRINMRVDSMMEEGLEDEARALYPHRELNALKTVGYRELFGYFDGKHDRTEAIRLIKQNTRRYAKRQLTWLRRYSDIRWFSNAHTENIRRWVDGVLQDQ